MDLLSDVLHVVRLRGSVFFTASLTAPWCLRTPRRADPGPALPFRTGHLMLFEIVAEGSAWIRIDDAPAHHLPSGSVVLVPDAEGHLIGSSATEPPQPLTSHLPFFSESRIPHLDYGGGGERTDLVCGLFYCDQRLSPLLDSLPSALILNVEREPEADANTGIGIVELKSDEWLRLTVRHAVHEARRREPAAAAMLARLTELLFVDVLRRYVRGLPEGTRGWPAAVHDPEIGRAIALLHDRPANRWTVGTLAAEVGVSRSALAHRFTTLLGESPMHYLINWKMQLAQRYLVQSNMTVKQIAFKLGYESDAAFSRAFKRCTGDPPASWRRRAYI